MSAQAVDLVWASTLRGSQRLVALALAWRCPEGETAAAPSGPDLARLAGLSPDQTRRILHRLADEGSIRCLDSGGGRRAAMYELTPCTNASPGADARAPLAPAPGHPLHSCARAVKGKSKTTSTPRARVRAPDVGGLALDPHGITHKPNNERDAEALRRIAQHTAQAIEAAVHAASAADAMGRAWPSKVLRLLSPSLPSSPPIATPTTPGWATCADWMN